MPPTIWIMGGWKQELSSSLLIVTGSSIWENKGLNMPVTFCTLHLALLSACCTVLERETEACLFVALQTSEVVAFESYVAHVLARRVLPLAKLKIAARSGAQAV